MGYKLSGMATQLGFKLKPVLFCNHIGNQIFGLTCLRVILRQNGHAMYVPVLG